VVNSNQVLRHDFSFSCNGLPAGHLPLPSLPRRTAGPEFDNSS
jgi:hypothetical protein